MGEGGDSVRLWLMVPGGRLKTEDRSYTEARSTTSTALIQINRGSLASSCCEKEVIMLVD